MHSTLIAQHLSDEIAATQKKIDSFEKKTAGTEQETTDSTRRQNNLAVYKRKQSLLESLLAYSNGTGTREDAVLADVVNDLMQCCGVLDKNKTFRDLASHPADPAP